MKIYNNNLVYKVFTFSFFIIICSIPLLNMLTDEKQPLQMVLGLCAALSLTLIFSFNYGLVLLKLKKLNNPYILFIMIANLTLFMAWLELTTKPLNLLDEDYIIRLLYNNEITHVVIFISSIYLTSQCLTIVIFRFPWKKQIDENTVQSNYSLDWNEKINSIISMTELDSLSKKPHEKNLKRFIDIELEVRLTSILEKPNFSFYNPENHIPDVMEKVTLELIKRLDSHNWPNIDKRLNKYLQLNFREFIFDNLIRAFAKEVSNSIDDENSDVHIHPRSMMIFLSYLEQATSGSGKISKMDIRNSSLKHLVSDKSNVYSSIKDARIKRKLVTIYLLIYLRYNQFNMQSRYLDEISLVFSMKEIGVNVDAIVEQFGPKMGRRVSTKYLTLMGWNDVNTADRIDLPKTDVLNEVISSGEKYLNAMQKRLMLIDAQNNNNELLYSGVLFSEFVDNLKTYMESL